MSPPDPAVVVVLTTLPPDADVASFAHALVEARVAACVSVLAPMRSVYHWNGRVEEATEHQLVIKTTADRLEALGTLVHARHPYDVPEFVVVEAGGGSDAYLAWVKRETRGA